MSKCNVSCIVSPSNGPVHICVRTLYFYFSLLHREGWGESFVGRESFLLSAHPVHSEYVDVAFFVVVYAVSTGCLDQIIIGSGGNGFAALGAVPTLGGVLGVEELLSPTVEDPHLEPGERLILDLEYLVGARGRVGCDEVGYLQERLGYLDGIGLGVGAVAVITYITIIESRVVGARFAEGVIDVGDVVGDERRLERLVVADLPRHIVDGVGIDFRLEVNQNGTGTHKGAVGSLHGVGKIVYVCLFVDVRCVARLRHSIGEIRTCQ